MIKLSLRKVFNLKYGGVYNRTSLAFKLFPTILLNVNSLFTSTSELVAKDLYANNSVNEISSSLRPKLELVRGVHREWLLLFQQNNITDPELSIQFIIEHVMEFHQGCDFDSLMEKETPVTTEQAEQIRTLCECRLARMPVQYLLKQWDFRELQLAMVPPVFIPRSETEQLVDLVLKAVSPTSRFLEVGCGSGAVCLSLLQALPQAQVIAIDQSKMACQLTKKNAQLNGLSKNLMVMNSKLNDDGSLSEPLPVTCVDVIVSNPPYIPSVLLPTLQPEITLYEDLRALDGGRDGLRVVKALLTLSKKLLSPGGDVFLEVDSTHPPVIDKWLTLHPQLNLHLEHTHKDYCDKDRFVHLKKS